MISIWPLLLATKVWEQRKLENLSEHKSGTSIEKYFSSDGLYKVISIGSYGLNNEYIDQGIRAVKNKTTESKLVRSGQLTMVLNDKTANGNLIGRCLLISTDNEFIVNQRTEIIIPGPDLNGNYAYYYLNGPFRSKVKRIAQGGTQIYVNYSSVKKQKINYPIKDEQIKISKLLKIIKKLITLYEKKKQLLTQLKQGIVNFLITKNGQKPQLRFSGFNNNWESKSFEKLLNYEQPTKYIVKKADYISQGTPVLTANKSFVLGYTNETNVYQNIPAIIFDDFTLESKYVDFPFMVKSSAIKILTSENSNLFFIYQLLNNQRFVQEGHSRHYISVVQKKKVLVPSIQEQNKISDLIKQLEDNIELNSNTIVLLKKLKEFLLQSMFL
ncbi:restriction endonuclease subunit S [Ligilactobacillus aviarius]|uniref:restriction endonuclease subunit S n=1 Tax=Ligilactobacillus aviarius TaxID=1606 RepID=UPI0032178FAA